MSTNTDHISPSDDSEILSEIASYRTKYVKNRNKRNSILC